jgi:hypothetical protein
MHVGPYAMIVSAIRISADVRSIVFHYCCLLHKSRMLAWLIFCNDVLLEDQKVELPLLDFFSLFLFGF